MKELSIEEKAKCYDEALERAKDMLSYKEVRREDMEYLFPELAESDDEKIRKELIHYFSDGVEFLSLCSFSREDILAWLEKQDPKKLEEQFDKMIEADLSWLEKSTDDKIEPKFNIGDIIFNKKTKEQFAITDRSLALQYYHDEDHLHEVRFSEQDDWEIIKPKFHEGDWVVVSTAEGDRVVQIASVEYFEDGCPQYFTTNGRWFSNGTKARLLTDKDVETITLPESKVIVNKKPAEWSEEDEDIFNYLKGLTYSRKDTELAQRAIDWLKSIRHQKQWNPSKEQMKALHDLNLTGNLSYAGQGQALIDLYNSLKELC